MSYMSELLVILCRMGPGGLPDISAIMNDPSMLANMQSMFNSLTPAQMVDMAKQAGVNLNEQQASYASVC